MENKHFYEEKYKNIYIYEKELKRGKRIILFLVELGKTSAKRIEIIN